MDKIHVLEKAFIIMEMIAEKPNTPHTVSELSQKTGINVQTLSRIVRTMTIMGYLESAGRKTGYLMGKKFVMLSDGYFDSNPLRKAALPLLLDYRDKINEYICVSHLLGYERHIVCIVGKKFNVCPEEDNQYIKISATVQTPYDSVSGKLMLSRLSVEQQKKCFEWFGPPGNKWDGITTEKDFLSHLEDIAQHDYLIEHKAARVNIVYLINLSLGEVAAVGSSIEINSYSEEKKDVAMKLLKNISTELEKKSTMW